MTPRSFYKAYLLAPYNIFLTISLIVRSLTARAKQAREKKMRASDFKGEERSRVFGFCACSQFLPFELSRDMIPFARKPEYLHRNAGRTETDSKKFA